MDFCIDPTRVCEHHGDYQGMSSNNAGGIDIVSEAVPDGYGKHITFELGLEGDLNDVRAPGSEVIEWYYELGAKWIPFEPSSRKTDAAAYNNIKPVSFHNFAGPGDFYFSKQSSYIFTFQAPTDSESIFWYSGRMHQSGKLLRNKQHAHNIIFEEAIFFAASPEELGLTKENGLLPTKPFLPVKSASTRFGTNSEIKKFILENLKASSIVSRLLAESSNNATSIPNLRHRRFIEGNISISNNVHINIQHPHTTSNIEPQISMEHRTSSPKAICHSVHNYEMIGGYKFDRKTPTCCQEWSFKKGDIFTTLAFHRKVTDSSLGPHQADHPSIPPTIPGHVGWWLSYDTQELPIAQSHFSIVQYTNDPDSQYEDIKHLDGAVRLNVGLNRGITNSNNISSAKFLLATIIISIVQHFFLSILLMIALVFGFRRLYSILYGPGGYWANKLITLSAADNNIHDPSAPGVFEVVVKNCRD